jgi:hypothetical protein
MHPGNRPSGIFNGISLVAAFDLARKRYCRRRDRDVDCLVPFIWLLVSYKCGELGRFPIISSPKNRQRVNRDGRRTSNMEIIRRCVVAGRLELVSVRLNPFMSPIDTLLASLKVEVGALAECLVSKGWRLSFPESEMPGLHYTVKGTGQIRVGDAPPISIVPHTLVITPPGRPYRFEAPRREGAARTLRETKGLMGLSALGTLQTFVAGDGEPDVTIICGAFRAYYRTSIDLFATMSSPIVELFDSSERLARQLRLVLVELSGRRVGMAAMTSSMLTQVLLALLRRRLDAGSSGFEGLAVLSDVQIARSFAEMVAQPGAPNTVGVFKQIAQDFKGLWAQGNVTIRGTQRVARDIQRISLKTEHLVAVR